MRPARRTLPALMLLLALAPWPLQAQILEVAGSACGAPSCAAARDALQDGGFALRLLSIGYPSVPALRREPAPLTRLIQGLRPQRTPTPGDGSLQRLQTQPLAPAKNHDALVHVFEGRFDIALREFTGVAAQAPDGGVRHFGPAGLNNAAVVEALAGQPAQALERLRAALAAYQALEAPNLPPPAYRLVGELTQNFMRLPPPQRAEAARELQQETAASERRAVRSGVLIVQLNLANLQAHLGQFAEAEATLQAALQREQAQEPASLARAVHAERQRLYARLGRAQAAADARGAAEAAPPLPQGRLPAEFGALALSGKAAVAAAAAASAPAEIELRPSSAAETAFARLMQQAAADEAAGQQDAAADRYGRAAQLALAVGVPERERQALVALQRVSQARGQLAAAVFFGKRAVEAAERQRQALAGLDRAARQRFFAERRDVHVALLQQLLDQGRLAEAEAVARLMKADEGAEFSGAAGGTGDGMAYTRAERQVLTGLVQLAQRTRELEATREAVRRSRDLDFLGRPELATRADVEAARRTVLGRMVKLVRLVAGKPGAPRPEAAPRRTPSADPASMRPLIEGLARQNDLALGVVRQVLDDGERFMPPLPADERAAAQALYERLQANVAILSAPAGPLSPDLLPPTLLAPLAPQGKALQTLWASDRGLEDLDRERAVLEHGLAALPAGSKQAFEAADLARLEAPQRLFDALPADSAALYYVVGTDRVDVLLSSRQGRQARRLGLGRKALEAQVEAFIQALRSPLADPRPAARALHETLLRPLRPALQAAGTRTLMLSLDGPLRTLPFAALHDETGWLVQRYALAVYTTPAAQALTTRPQGPRDVTAFGSTRGGAGLRALPYVEPELRGIVRSAAGAPGVLPGTVRLDGEFTAEALARALRGRQRVVHIASHFVFDPDDAQRSFLLLGDGSKLGVTQLASPTYRFDSVELVTLSACDTARAGDDRFGQEVEGLGSLLQGQGAATVLATLWPLRDASSAPFMQSFYDALERQQLSKAAALQQAQLRFIGAQAMVPAGPARGGALDDEAPARMDAARPYAHPYFWAPFVLMGNWL